MIIKVLKELINMPIDKNGYIIPPEEDKKRKRSNYMITKIIKNIDELSFFFLFKILFFVF